MKNYRGGEHHLHPDTRKLAGVVSAIPAENFYTAIGEPLFPQLPSAAKEYIVENILPTLQIEKKKKAIQLITFGIGDVSILVELLARAHPEFTKEQAMQAMQHPETIASHARIASTTHAIAGEIYRKKNAFITPNEDSRVEVVADIAQVEGRGCPAVLMEGSEISATPVFQTFTKWAGSLAVHAAYRSK